MTTVQKMAKERAKLRADREKLVEAIRQAIREMDIVWIEANALRDSKAAGEMGRNLRKTLREVGDCA